MDLSDLHRRLLAFIQRYQLEQGFPPGYRQICKEFGWRSTGAAGFHVTRLKAAGFVDQAGQGIRSLHLTERGFRALAANP